MKRLRAPKVEQLDKHEGVGSKRFLKRKLRKAIRKVEQTEKPVRGFRGYSS